MFTYFTLPQFPTTTTTTHTARSYYTLLQWYYLTSNYESFEFDASRLASIGSKVNKVGHSRLGGAGKSARRHSACGVWHGGWRRRTQIGQQVRRSLCYGVWVGRRFWFGTLWACTVPMRRGVHIKCAHSRGSCVRPTAPPYRQRSRHAQPIWYGY